MDAAGRYAPPMMKVSLFLGLLRHDAADVLIVGIGIAIRVVCVELDLHSLGNTLRVLVIRTVLSRT